MQLFAFALPFATLTAQPKILSFEGLKPDCKSETPDRKTGQIAFNGAPEIGVIINYLKKKHAIDMAIETGTHKENTTAFLASLFNQVISIEIHPQWYETARENLQEFDNLLLIQGSSDQVFHEILPGLKEQRILFYLDAHWQEHWPLREEIKSIARTHKDRCVIIIDDFKVPGRPDIPYDKYHKNECSYDYIEDLLQETFTSFDVWFVIPKNVLSRAKFVAFPHE